MAVMYSLSEAQSQLDALVDEAANGKDIIIEKSGKPLAKLVSFAAEPRKPGIWEGRLQIPDDFDDPLPEEILDAFEGRGR